MSEAISLYLRQLWEAGLAILQPTTKELERGLELHRTLDVCDGYGFLPRVFTAPFRERNEALLERGLSKTEWARKYWAELAAAPAYDKAGAQEFVAALEHTGLAGLVLPINDIGENLDDAIVLMASYRHLCERFSSHLFQATTPDALTREQGKGRMGVVFSLTGLPIFGAGSMADPDGLLDWLEIWHRFGVRMMHLTYNRRNHFADGCTEEGNAGLSDLGQALVARMNAVGIIPDVAHGGSRTTLETVRASQLPVIATHIGCAGVFEHPRCKSDAEIRAIADSGGYVGIFTIPSFLAKDGQLQSFLQHVRHAVDLVGAAHVAIGTDNTYLSPIEQRGIRPHPGKPAVARAGWKPHHRVHDSTEHLCGSLAWSNWPLFIVGLVQLGLSDEEIAMIAGGNLRRVLTVTEAAVARGGG